MKKGRANNLIPYGGLLYQFVYQRYLKINKMQQLPIHQKEITPSSRIMKRTLNNSQKSLIIIMRRKVH
jgi:hypothetical protein